MNFTNRNTFTNQMINHSFGPALLGLRGCTVLNALSYVLSGLETVKVVNS